MRRVANLNGHPAFAFDAMAVRRRDPARAAGPKGRQHPDTLPSNGIRRQSRMQTPVTAGAGGTGSIRGAARK